MIVKSLTVDCYSLLGRDNHPEVVVGNALVRIGLVVEDIVDCSLAGPDPAGHILAGRNPVAAAVHSRNLALAAGYNPTLWVMRYLSGFL